MKAALKSLTISVVIIIHSFYSFSQQSPDSLLKYLEIAAKCNPSVLQRFNEYEASLKKIPQAGTLPDPQLDIGVFITPMELVGGNQIADMRLMQMFPWFGVLKNAKDEMSLMAKAKFELFRDTELQVFYDVQRTWYELYRIRKDISISEKNIEILRVIEQLALIKYKAPATLNSGSGSQQSGMQIQSYTGVNSSLSSGMQGMGDNQAGQGIPTSEQTTTPMQPGSMVSSSDGLGLTDLYRIQIETGELKSNIALLKTQERTVVARFNNYLSRPQSVPVYTNEKLLPDTLDMNFELVRDSIQNRNPMLKMIDFEKEAYLARGKMVKRMGYPMVGLGLNYSFIGRSDMSTSLMNGRDMIMPMVSMTLPIYRKKYNAMQSEADLLSRANSRNFQATSISLQNEYYMAIQLYQDAQRRISLYENQYLLASKIFNVMLKNFSTSSAGLTDVLRVLQQTLDYELKQIEAVTDLNTSKAWLNRLMAISKIQNAEIQ